jgi:hypothetical protein
MNEDERISEVYKAPMASARSAPEDEAPVQPTSHRLAGLLLIVLTSYWALVWLTRQLLRIPTPWLAPVASSVFFFALGFALRGSSDRIWRLVTLVSLCFRPVLLILMLRPLLRDAGAAGVALATAFISRGMEALPFFLLLIGTPSRARRTWAVGVFTLVVLVELLMTVVGLYTGHYVSPRGAV